MIHLGVRWKSVAKDLMLFIAKLIDIINPILWDKNKCHNCHNTLWLWSSGIWPWYNHWINDLIINWKHFTPWPEGGFHLNPKDISLELSHWCNFTGWVKMLGWGVAPVARCAMGLCALPNTAFIVGFVFLCLPCVSSTDWYVLGLFFLIYSTLLQMKRSLLSAFLWVRIRVMESQ